LYSYQVKHISTPVYKQGFREHRKYKVKHYDDYLYVELSGPIDRYYFNNNNQKTKKQVKVFILTINKLALIDKGK
jgi:hypothetical protein